MKPFGVECDSAAQRQLDTTRRLRELEKLPPLPQEEQSLLAMVRDPDVDVDRLVAALERCPSVAARILSVARSAFFAQRIPATSVRDAVVRVFGLRLVADLVCCMVLRGPLATGRCRAFDPQRYWCRSLLTAVLAQRFARLTCLDQESSGASYLSGLTHSLGLLALVHLDPDGMSRVFAARASGEYPSLTAAEESLIGVTHCQAGGRLAEAWKLPAALAVVMSCYREPDYRGEGWQLNRLVTAAALAAEHLTDEATGEPTQTVDELGGLLGLPAADEALAAALDAARVSLEDFRELAKQFASGEQ